MCTNKKMWNEIKGQTGSTISQLKELQKLVVQAKEDEQRPKCKEFENEVIQGIEDMKYLLFELEGVVDIKLQNVSI